MALNTPGNRLEGLKGDRKGQYSVRINDQWRICFEWPEGSPGPLHVEIVDSEHTSQLCCADVFSGHSDAVLQ
jgi:plasmid maintenance system killer protein